MKVKADDRLFQRFKSLSEKVQADLRFAQGLVQNDMEVDPEQIAEVVDSMSDARTYFTDELDSIMHALGKHLEECNSNSK